MRVSDIMSKALITVSENTPLKEVGRIIFSLGIGGVPVIKEGKLVGIVTEQDILSKMYPTVGELIEDYVHARNFEEMEENLGSLLNIPVSKIMSRKPTSISPNTPIMNAQSIMLINKFSRIPVVDNEKNLLGIISQGDIFRQLIKKEIPKLEKEKYADFIGQYYDQMVDWEEREKNEIPAILKLFRSEKVKSVLDLGVWTGKYTIELAKREKLKILGLDHNPSMIKICQKKKEELAEGLRRNIDFMLTDFIDFPSRVSEKFDAAICMGGSLPYIPTSLNNLFKAVSSVLPSKNGIIILQILNFDKILHQNRNLLDFRVQESAKDPGKKHLFIEFLEREKNNRLLHHLIFFDSDGENWIFKRITTIDIANYKKREIEIALRKFGFGKISISGTSGEYQGNFGKLSFNVPFDPLKSDWLNVVAKR